MVSWTCIGKNNVKGYSFYKTDNGTYMLQVIWYVTCNECNAMDITEHRSPWYPMSKEDLESLLNIKVV